MMQKHAQISIKGSAFVALAALCWGVSGGIAGILLADGWDAFTVSFVRGAIGLMVLLVWLFLSRRTGGLKNPRLWFWSAVAGLGVAGNFSFYFLSIREGGVAVAATLMYCAPVFVYMVSFGLKLERPTPLKWAAIGVVILGIVLLTGLYDAGARSVTPVGMGTGLLAGLSYGIFIFGFSYAARYGSPQEILVIAFTVFVFLLIWPSDAGQIVAAVTTTAWPLFLILGVLGAGVSFFFYIVGLRHTAPTTASIVAMIEPVTASLFGVVMLNETLTGLQIVGMGLILVTVTALSVASTAHP
ncbi:DMT family transporter [Desulfatiferula olefinivorans]